MPTPKQVRYHYGQLYRWYWRLQTALNNAHDAGVIEYDKTKYKEEGPCATHWETWDRVKKTTEKQLAAAMREEIESKK